MDEKMFELMEKLYVEFLGFKKEVRDEFDRIYKRFDEVDKRFDEVDKRFDEHDKRFDSLEARMTKMEIKQENMEEKLDEAFEAITHLAEVNERQHQEIMRELRGEIQVIDLALKRVSNS